MQPLRLFTLARVPVHLSMGYFLLALYFAYGTFELGAAYAAVSVLVLTISLLVHEFGHALTARHFKLEPQVVLHGWGGLCVHQPAQRPRDSALIIAAGPAAGLVLGGIAWGARELLLASAPEIFVERQLFGFMLNLLVYVNIYWSLLNLIPLWPLDGGQLFRLLMLRVMSKQPNTANRVVHIVGLAIGVAGAIVGVVMSYPFAAIIAGLLAFENVRRMNAPEADGRAQRRRENPAVDALLAEAGQALARGDARETLRLAYQAKDASGLSQRQLDAAWMLLTIGSAAGENWDDAVYYSQRAPRLAPVFAARVRALVGLGRIEEARRELRADDVPAMSPEQRELLDALVA